MTQNKIFKEIDLLLNVKLSSVTQDLSKFKEFLESQNIALATQANEDERVGDILINMLNSINTLLVDYKEIKDTWQVTTV